MVLKKILGHKHSVWMVNTALRSPKFSKQNPSARHKIFPCELLLR